MQTFVNYTSASRSLSALKGSADSISLVSADVLAVYRSISVCTGIGPGPAAALKTVMAGMDENTAAVIRIYAAGCLVMDRYCQCENKLLGVQELSDESSKSGVQLPELQQEPNMTYPASLGALASVFGGMLDSYNDVGSGLKNLGTISGLIEYFTGSELAGTIQEYAKDVSGKAIFDVAGYIKDGKTLVNALVDGDWDKLGDLFKKYEKKGTKHVIKGVVSEEAIKALGATYGIYIDLGQNIGENLADGVWEVIREPSAASAAKIVWGVTGGALVDTGIGLAEDVLDFTYSLLGKDFDKADFHEAMDYLGNAIVDGVADTCVTAWNGIKTVSKTVASWFKWF